MQPLKRKCLYKRSGNFKVILNRFLYGGKKLVPDDVMKVIRAEIHDGTNILYPYQIPLTIPILECILKRNELMIYKDGIYLIFFKLSGKSFPHITTKECNSILNAFNVVSSIYDKYKPKGRKSFLNYFFVLKKLLIMLEKLEFQFYKTVGFIPINLVFSLFKALITFCSLEMHSLLLFDRSLIPCDTDN